jgi:hypothetical protein
LGPEKNLFPYGHHIILFPYSNEILPLSARSLKALKAIALIFHTEFEVSPIPLSNSNFHTQRKKKFCFGAGKISLQKYVASLARISIFSIKKKKKLDAI